jgi:alanine-glyoxylate transaminase/serine-glyoxylate transaminase/serine-pyruvate transaminase
MALDMLLGEGLPAIHERHRILAGAVRRAVEVWAESGALGFNITREGERSDTVTVVTLREGRDPQPIFDYAREKCGVILGSGIGDLSGKAFRIAHMGHVNAPMVLGTLGVVEMALAALDIPHGRGGVAAAIAFMAREVRP